MQGLQTFAHSSFDEQALRSEAHLPVTTGFPSTVVVESEYPQAATGGVLGVGLTTGVGFWTGGGVLAPGPGFAAPEAAVQAATSALYVALSQSSFPMHCLTAAESAPLAELPSVTLQDDEAVSVALHEFGLPAVVLSQTVPSPRLLVETPSAHVFVKQTLASSHWVTVELDDTDFWSEFEVPSV